MSVPKPVAVLVPSLAVLMLGLAALLTDQSGVASWFAGIQDGIWQAWGAAGAARPSWAKFAEAAFLIVTGGAAIALVLKTHIRRAALFVLCALIAAFYLGLLCARLRGDALDIVATGTMLLLVFATAAAARIAQIRARKRELQLAFANSLPRAAIDRIAHDPSLLSLDGETRNITYLACGMRGLADLSAMFRDDPKGFTRLLEQVLTPLMGQVLRHGGVIDRLTADGFTAYWNAPLDDPAHAAHACEAANGMITALARANEDLTAGYRLGGREVPLVEIGIGVATGPAIVGGFGGHGRLSYSVNGDAVRLAVLLQALSRNYGPSIIVAQETQATAGLGFAFLEVDYFAQGQDDPPIHLYAMLDHRAARTSPKVRALATFHEHIFQCLRNQQWDKARALIEQCARLSGASQTLYDLYRARIRYFETHPPGPGWDGAFRPVLK
ncbi:MAG: adenylate/guanylate cyclase domain-containing protein [Alphaproteobacteria bacterium]|nr:adenylate/guanylate cyclase domain-containing protein [Alphaproteobacteria bacterium]